MPTYERLDYGSVDGSQWGTSTDALGMYGATPSLQSSQVNISSATGSDTSTVCSTLVVALKRIGIVA